MNRFKNAVEITVIGVIISLVVVSAFSYLPDNFILFR